MYQHDQLYYECQLISIWNAAKYFGIEGIPEIGSKEYRKICGQCRCLKKGCITVKKELMRLGLYTVEGNWDLSWVRNNLPVDVGIFYKKNHYYHSVLITNVHGYKIQLANYAKKRSHWMLWSQLKEKAKNPETEEVYENPFSYKKGRFRIQIF